MARKTIMLIGTKKSGKSALIQRLVGNKFNDSYIDQPKADVVADRKGRLMMAPPGGWRVDEALDYLRPKQGTEPPSVVVVCIDLTANLRDQKEYLGHLLDAIRLYDPKPPIALVATKGDVSADAKKVTDADLDAFQSELKEAGYTVSLTKVSAKDNTNIGALQVQLESVISEADKQANKRKKIAPLFAGIESKIHELQRRYKTTKTSTGKVPFDAATTLSSALDAAKEAYVKGEINATQLKTQCREAIAAAKPVFSQHRGWHGLNAMLRGFIGILATISVIPAVAVALTTKQGYVDTFFTKPETDSKVKLDEFERKLDEDDGKHFSP